MNPHLRFYVDFVSQERVVAEIIFQTICKELTSFKCVIQALLKLNIAFDPM